MTVKTSGPARSLTVAALYDGFAQSRDRKGAR